MHHELGMSGFFHAHFFHCNKNVCVCGNFFALNVKRMEYISLANYELLKMGNFYKI